MGSLSGILSSTDGEIRDLPHFAAENSSDTLRTINSGSLVQAVRSVDN